MIKQLKFFMALLFLVSFSAQAKKQTLYTVYGDNAGDRLGYSVSTAGDVNNDGYADVIIGTYYAPTNFGSARVLSGIDGGVLHLFIGDLEYGRFGSSVSGAGDVNGDGYDDVIVGDYYRSSTSRNGMARIFSGLDGNILHTFFGNDLDQLGISVSDAGDINNDGYDDVIVGANGDDINGPNSGSAYVYSGLDGTTLYAFYGDNSGDYFGYSVSGAEDVNKDGYDDVIVGAYLDSNNGSYSGSARVLSGIDGSTLYSFDGDDSFDNFGVSVGNAGDVNNDGYPDFVVGALGDDNNGDLSGSARVFSGANGGILYTFNGDSLYEDFGISVSSAGDVNNDSYADVIVGAYLDDNNGSGYGSGSAQIFSGINGEVIYTFNGNGEDYNLGWSVSAAGDVNNDGYADMIIGAPGEDNNSDQNGSARVLSGRKLFSKRNDFTDDGTAGWIWKGESNGVEGSSRTWSLDWLSASPGWVPPLRTYPPFWGLAMEYDIETTGDFDGDGDADWLWRGRSDGRWKIWEMESGTRVGQTTPPDFDASHDYTIVGSGDTDKDGDDDVFLNDISTGEILIGQMENNAIINTYTVGTKAGYEVVRVGDFDGDYDQDLLLQLSGGNTLRFWEIENNAFAAEHTTPQTGSGFTTQCAGDFNGDGNDDVYLLAGDGTSKWYEYVDFVRQQQVFGANQAAWILLGCGDYDGDGDMDILWTSADGLGYNRLFINESFNNSATFYTNRYGGTNPANPGYGYEKRGNSN